MPFSTGIWTPDADSDDGSTFRQPPTPSNVRRAIKAQQRPKRLTNGVLEKR
jgi:hypothetical protein